ncbi:MAG TPA: FHA domain-containing protein [Paraburkholderia sp.]|nr:FHA domain-containing protein [Paraburkholderia sp.]
MSECPHLLVSSGLHAGASVVLSEGHELKIGSANGADLILADHGVAAHHATVSLIGNRLVLHAVAGRVTVFGRAIKTGAQTQVRYGATFGVGETRLQFTNSGLLSAETTLQAELAWLLRHAPLAWLRRRLTTLPGWVWAALATVPLVLAAVYWLGLLAPHSPQRPRTALLDQAAYRDVRVSAEKETGRRVYEGYVQTVGELGALSLDARAQGGLPVLHVNVIDVMQEQLSDFLDKYYRGAQLRAAEPGAFVVSPPGAEAYLSPDSWDYARLERQARAQIEGLRILRFTGHDHESGPARIPLEAVGLNLLSTRHGAWLVDPQGMRYFSGAHTPAGRITSIAKCSATVVRDDGSVYLLVANRTERDGPC